MAEVKMSNGQAKIKCTGCEEDGLNMMHAG
jgi:hypothetical protein